MTVTNSQAGTNVHEIAAGVYRISTPVSAIPGGFTFNQILLVDDEPLLFHTGLKRMFPLVKEAVAHVLGDVAKLRHVGFSHFESDECGALNEWLAVAPAAQPVCGTVAAMVSVQDFADRAPRALADGEELSLGKKKVRWLDAPHLPHNWECGFMFESTTRTLLCGDLFTQGGTDNPPITERDILGPSEALRKSMGGVAIEAGARKLLTKLASTEPTTLATMHGSSFRGDGAALLLGLARELGV
ncbi:MAG TPA: MBL fold metallo-hydrolase [Polyangiaceae bacterium]|nr:MBL fold metallo-hydrolase [Polyangiaceae bacterium]